MIQTSTITSEFQRKILNFCAHIAESYKILAICQSDDYTHETLSAGSPVEVLVVLQYYQPKIMSHVRVIDTRNVVFFVVDQWIFERDVDRGFLGEALASFLIFPYTALDNQGYIYEQEIALKKRLIIELLENIVFSYPEFSYRMRIKPEYFMYEVMLNRIRVFPPLAYGASDFLCGDANKEKIQHVLKGYLEALTQLSKEGTIVWVEDSVVVSEKFIEASKNPKIWFNNGVKNAPRFLFTPIFSVFPQLLNFLSKNSQAFFRFQTLRWRKDADYSKTFVNPQKFISVPTSVGFVSLADKMDIGAYTKQVLGPKYKDITVQEFGGVLNDVYLIRATMAEGEKKVLVKRFKNLSSMKWFPLSIWSIGARSFALIGRSRLERECAINDLLGKAGINVPKILHVSANERLVFMDFLEGENLSYAIKRIAAAHANDNYEKDLALVAQVGQTYAKVHALDVALGDTKPENSMVDPQDKIYLLDFEQATRNGDKAWDLACFLYYCGHYMPLNGEHKAEQITKAFITGYLRGGGNVEFVKCVGLAKYTRVFSVFTLPGVLRVIASTCRNIDGRPRKKSLLERAKEAVE